MKNIKFDIINSSGTKYGETRLGITFFKRVLRSGKKTSNVYSISIYLIGKVIIVELQ